MKGKQMQNVGDVLSGGSMLESWMATRRWTTTGSGNKRRVVNTPGHMFVVVEKPKEVLALYRSDEDPNWITVASKRTVSEAKAALLTCATEAMVQWL